MATVQIELKLRSSEIKISIEQYVDQCIFDNAKIAGVERKKTTEIKKITKVPCVPRAS